jgi:rSAM/selenodomain-associated transferase 2/rSAM/selenodomain-associated transferase 1
MTLLTACVFAKAPGTSPVKTRLAPVVGPGGAGRLARAFLGDTLEALRAMPRVRTVVATTGPLELDLPGLEVWDQGAGSLGDRLERVLGRALAAGAPVLALGADSPGLPASFVEAARGALRTRGAALGPSDDGGFWGLGLRALPAGLLSGIEWSSERTFAQTLARLEGAGLAPVALPHWFDADVPADLHRLGRLLDAGIVRAPRTARLLRELLPPVRPRVSVVIPVLDEAARLRALLPQLLGMRGIAEVIVADGGSRDASAEIAQRYPEVKWVDAPRGRGPQQNAGARAASGEVLLFLHADVRLPDDAAAHVRRALDDRRVVAGAFRTWTVRDEVDERAARSRIPGALLHLADLRSRYTGLPYGDQAIFVRREAFDAVGGFPEQPLFEDLELSRRLRRIGEIRTVAARVAVSGRRFLARPLRETLLVNLLPFMYRLGARPERLARVYRDFR